VVSLGGAWVWMEPCAPLKRTHRCQTRLVTCAAHVLVWMAMLTKVCPLLRGVLMAAAAFVAMLVLAKLPPLPFSR
jgi:pyrimidine deaminase RibD-like protein